MSSFLNQISTLEFHNELLLKMIDSEKYPFFTLVILNGLSKQEMNDIFSLCDEINERYNQQKEAGFLDYTPLLTHFAGMLTPKMPIKETIAALLSQGLYSELMEKLLDALERLER